MCMLRCFHIHPVRSSCPGGWDYSAQKNPSGCVCSTQSKQVPRSPPGRAECTDCCLVAQSVPRIGQSQRPLLRREEQFLHTGPHWLLRTQRHLVTDWDVRLLHPVLPCLPHGGSEGRMDKKGLRVRNSPTCTLSQNGYGDGYGSNITHGMCKHDLLQMLCVQLSKNQCGFRGHDNSPRLFFDVCWACGKCMSLHHSVHFITHQSFAFY